MIKTIAFDADDTLWVNETIFTSTRDKIEHLLKDYVTHQSLEKTLYETEIKNLNIFGYGIKGFMLSTIETCIEITQRQIDGETIQKLIDLGKDMLSHPVEILPGIENAVKSLQGNYQLMIITKGDLFDQESKIARSGLADYFDIIEVVSEKNEKTYQNLLNKYDINSNDFLMIGNSIKSDILPICKIGGEAIHIPFHTTWEHEIVSQKDANGHQYYTLSSIEELQQCIGQINQRKMNSF
ncbi:MAG: HAD family hydrolase [Bacteroidota bacterium]